ncbi:MAG: hypothetical protein M0P02_00440 [Sulfurospirillaceae bacterium]|jgi:hypothetical protein|nr:hypothetical protein [Sulfurospirillaceae bacterium]MCK9545879.1 hypothetical protein [Sulfurospirillaceae bacterium]MDY0237684.1 hypothetical protein [Campylobacterales bacterium]
MSYSFVKPKLKPVFTLFSKIWIFFILFCTIVILAFDFFTIFSTKLNKDGRENQLNLRDEYSQKIEATDRQITFIKKQKAAAEGVYASNAVLKDSLQNLFDLIPDQITLSKIDMDKNSLIIYGKTPSKDTFNFLLASPLRSIFHTSNTVFYLNEDGWYRFVSTNKILDSDGFNE